MIETAVPPPSTAAPTAKAGLRADIQALRALAVGSVMLYHLWPAHLSGGYVGVDVFFAISGFLITSHLVSEVDATGRLRPARFWARRAKRLVPASALVLLATGVATLIWVPRYLWHQFFTEIIASTLQAQNWVLAHNAVDYLAANNPPSPTQHFWTLAVEEQFYLGLPILLLLAIGLSRASRIPRRTVIASGLAAIAAGSLAYSIMLTHSTPGVAYFSTFTRAWEFALGALLAFVPRPKRALPTLLPWLGIAAIVVACFRFDAGTVFPGYAAALPVLGAVFVIWSGRGTSLDRVGRIAPIAFLGRISYAAYLWHWPMLVILPFAVHHELTARPKLAIIAMTLLLAWISTTFIEDPIRFNPRLLGRRRPRVVFTWAAAAMAVVLVLSLAARHDESRREHQLAQQADGFTRNQPRCLGAQSMDPAYAPCTNGALNGVLVPSLALAPKDDANELPCWGQDSTGAKLCHLGPQTGAVKHVYAIGDSHNNTLIGVYRSIAEKNNWSIDVSGTAGCYLTTAQQTQPDASAIHGCEKWHASVLAKAAAGHYDAIIVTHSDRDRLVPAQGGKTSEQATVDGLVDAWNELPDIPIIAIRDNPSPPVTNAGCVNEHKQDAAQFCSIPRSQAVRFDGQAEAAARVPRVRVVDLTSFYCDNASCSPVIGHVLVYRDQSHITATWATTLAPYLNRDIVAALKA